MGQRKYRRGFEFVEHDSEVDLPLSWKKSKKIFVNSMSDLFHENSNFEFIAKCFVTMIQADWHDYQILTKRPERMIHFSELFFQYFGHKIPNFVWMGTSIENKNFRNRISHLRKVKCHTRFISFEPLLDSVGKINLRGINWVIIGGESGHNFRRIKKEWVLEIIEQCQEQNVPVFFKQWGGYRPKSGGRTIEGKKYSEYPVFEKRNKLKKIHFDEVSFAKICLKNKIYK